jgi:hypothetical protein
MTTLDYVGFGHDRRMNETSGITNVVHQQPAGVTTLAEGSRPVAQKIGVPFNEKTNGSKEGLRPRNPFHRIRHEISHDNIDEKELLQVWGNDA